MNALVVDESMFGNTRKIADAIASGLAERGSVVVADVADAPVDIPADVDLLVVGGPTHAFGMSRPATRRDALNRGGAPRSLDRGIREWLGSLAKSDHRIAFAAFDTRVGPSVFGLVASSGASRAARRLGYRVLDHRSVEVQGTSGPVVAGELGLAHTWGVQLALTAEVTP